MRKLVGLIFIISTAYLTAQVTDENGRKQGYWKKKDEKTGKLIYEGEFKDDKPVGLFKYYYPNDSLQAIMDFRGQGTIAYAKLFHPTGKRMGQGKYINELKDSVWLYYDELGTLLSKDTYKNGKKHGASLVYMPEGLVAEERNFKNDLEDGEFKQYFDGKKLRGIGKYVDGKQEGKAVYYFPNGVEVATGFYKNGVKEGPWIYKNEQGKITEKELYRKGEPVSKKESEAFFNKNKPKSGGDTKGGNQSVKPKGK